MFSRDVKDAEAHKELDATVGGVELSEACEHGRARRRQGWREVRARLLGHVGRRRGVERPRDGVVGREAFDAPEHDGVFVTGAGEDEVAVEGDAVGCLGLDCVAGGMWVTRG